MQYNLTLACEGQQAFHRLCLELIRLGASSRIITFAFLHPYFLFFSSNLKMHYLFKSAIDWNMLHAHEHAYDVAHARPFFLMLSGGAIREALRGSSHQDPAESCYGMFVHAHNSVFMWGRIEEVFYCMRYGLNVF